MQELKENSVMITSGMTAFYEKLGFQEPIDTSFIQRYHPGHYSVENNTICFVTKDEEVFVTPFTRQAVSTLARHGYAEDYFYVPFAQGDIPKEQRTRWAELREKAEKSYFRDYVSDCIKWSDRRCMKKLSRDILRCCMMMPDNGIRVKKDTDEDIYYPLCNQRRLDTDTAKKIGKYNKHNEVVVFVYRDGRTFLARGNWILRLLKEAGYERTNLFVPLSHGESILDCRIKRRWDAIK